MAWGDVQVTMVGNLVIDPELRYIQDGTAAMSLHVASAPRVHQDGQQVDGGGMSLTCSLQREAAENAVGNLSKGIRVIIQGRLRQYSHETREGEHCTVFKVRVDGAGPSLRFVRAQVTRTSRNGGGNFGGGNHGQGGNAGGGLGGDSGGS